MSSPFAALEDRLSAACDAAFAEMFEFRPMKYGPGGGRRLPDTDRSVAVVSAIFEAPPYRSTEFGTEARGSTPALMNKTRLSAADAAFAGYGKPRQYDEVMRIVTGERYEVATVEQDAEGRYFLGIKFVGKE